MSGKSRWPYPNTSRLRPPCVLPAGGAAQAEELARAMSFGPLTDDQVGEIDRILNRTPTPNAG